MTGIFNKTSGGQVITSNEYAYNKSHMRTSETVTNGQQLMFDKKSISYTNNNLNQVLSSTSPGRSYSYDFDGNLTGITENSESVFSADYDAENRPTSITAKDGQGVTHTYLFTYNPDGFIYSQVVDGTPTYFVRDGANTLQERGADGVTVQRAYVWDGVSPGGIGGLLEMTRDRKCYNYYYDGKGNVAACINADPNLSQADGEFVYYGYDSFGVLKAKSGTLEQPYMFSTKYYYAGFGGNDAGVRIYLSLLGRWLTQDPLGEAGGQNLYGFALNNAINFVDFFGLAGEPFGNINSTTNYSGPGGGLGELPGLTVKRQLKTVILATAVIGVGVLAAPEAEAAYYLSMARLTAWPGTVIASEILNGETGISRSRASGTTCACKEGVSIVGKVKHHSIPVEILKKELPKEIANDPFIRGCKGNPNRIPIPKDLHDLIHKGKGGGLYNEEFKEKILLLKEQGKPLDVENILSIKYQMIKKNQYWEYLP